MRIIASRLQNLEGRSEGTGGAAASVGSRAWTVGATVLACLVVASHTASAARILFRGHIVSTDVFHGSGLYATDLDGDGDVDLMSAATPDHEIAWYERRGPNARPSFVTHLISEQASGAQSVFAADVDGDGDTDVLSASSSDNKIAWYENDGACPPSFVEHAISTSADQAFSVLAADMDGDGDVDILSASVYDDKIAWYENHGGRPPSFVEHVITEDPDGLFGPREGMADWPIQVAGGDLDGDGDNDVIAASVYADHFYWYENDGGSPPQFTPRILDEMPWGQIQVHIIDMDRDGDLDIISSLGFEHQIAWFENDGALEPSFTLHPIWGGDWPPLSFFPADLDGDGDLDVVAPDVPANRTVWLESDGGTPPTFRQRSLIDYDDFHRVIAVDIDADGDPDPVGSLFGVILWYENRILRPHGTRGKPLPEPRLLQAGE